MMTRLSMLASLQWPDVMANQALSGLRLQYPHKVDHLWMEEDGLLSSPAALHPVFFGNYDWHSSVHSHWCLVRLLRRYPEHVDGSAIEEALRASVSVDGCKVEAAEDGGCAFRVPGADGETGRLGLSEAAGAKKQTSWESLGHLKNW